MEKTCRWTCGKFVMRLECDYYGRPAWACTEICSQHEPRETPLLVDALAKALRVIQDEDRLNELVALGRDSFNESMLVLLDRVFPEIEPALARYKEEVGDAEA